MSNATELLRRALDKWDAETASWTDLFEEIRTYLDSEPEADEPVAFIQPNHLDKAQFMPFLCRVEPKQRGDFIPLYTRPEPSRKPMTDEEIATEWANNCACCHESFAAGIRFAEKHHGIGEDYE